MATLIGLDLGTTTIAGVLWDSARRVVLRTACRPNDAVLPCLPATRAEQDPVHILARALEVLGDLASYGPVDGIGLAGQMHGLLCVAASGEPLTPLISWQDRRTAEPLPGGGTLLEEIRGRTEGLPWQQNGCRVEHGYGMATLYWLAHQGLLPARAARVGTLPGWLAARLTGQLPVSEPGLACSWGCYQAVEQHWDRALLERLALDERLLPPILAAGVPLGGLAPAAARQAGLPAGIPVHCPVGDQPAAFLASVPDPVTCLYVNIGTGGQVAWALPGFLPATPRAETRPLPAGGFGRVGATLCGGAAYAWLNRVLRGCLAEFGVGVTEEQAYEKLNALAAAAPSTDGLCVRTTFLGMRGDPAVQAGAIEGVTPGNLRLGTLARATLLGMVDELSELYSAHGGPAAGHRLLVAGGNAVQKNALLPGLLAERFGLPVRVSPWSEPAAVGAAMSILL
ncbi:MAG TPA: FGGY family carbohydrate kinase [Anaerolineae bacterium]|nr:FGGY family carbohydrate kinase [Anaerolineae bacterium]